MFYGVRLFLVSFLVLSCFMTFGSAATRLPDDEVETLKQIAKTLGKNWNFSVDPCSGELGWTTRNPVKGLENSVTCNCSFTNNTVCHVVSIVLKGQNLQGVLPPELAKLPYLQEIDLTRNFLNGTIPPEWGAMPLVNIDLSYNQLLGSILPTFDVKRGDFEFMYLTGNLLTGDAPVWMLERGANIDLSYNNFTVGGSAPSECLQRNVNLFGTSSMLNNSSGVVLCA